MNIFIILPTQLFKDIKILKTYDLVYLIEEPYYLNSNYHKQKLVLHIASLNYYYDYLINNNIKVKYINYNKINYSKFLNNNITMYNPIDKKMIKLYKKYNIKFLETPTFFNTYNDLLEYNKLKKSTKFTQSDFYKYQRIKYNILVDKNKNPLYNWRRKKALPRPPRRAAFFPHPQKTHP